VPIYEYKCQDCDEQLEALQQVSEPPLTTCPECGGSLKKLLSAPAFQFKGSGWYVTDYAGKSGGTSSEKGSDASGEKAESGSKSSDAKSDSKKKKSKDEAAA
jgi:putative FmdB family regulatory protein